jgi:hypothetical protein
LKLLLFWFPALAGLQPALAGCVYQAGLVIVAGAGPPVVGEIAGGYRFAGDVQPPLFPLLGGLGWTTPGILEVLIPGRMQGHGGTEEVSG